MPRTFQLYRFALIEAKNITRTRLEAEFKDGIASAHMLENAIERELTAERTCTPWRITDAEQQGSRDGTRMAALEFYWEHRHDLQPAKDLTQNRPETPSEAQPPTCEEVALMSNDPPQQSLLQELARLFRRFKSGGDLAPIDDRDEWEKRVSSNPPEEQELVNELARFADLWRYLQERNEKLGPEIVQALAEVHKLPVVSRRAARVREINQKLMRRIGEFDLGTPQ